MVVLRSDHRGVFIVSTETIQAVKCQGFPAGKVCDRPVQYIWYGLCKQCYEKRRAAIAREAKAARMRADAAEAPGVTPTEDNSHPHHCPLCGQGITRAHYRKASKVRYDKRTHPIRLARALTINRPHAAIARRFGITEAELEFWIGQFPEMQAAVTAVEEEAGVLYEAAVAKALGAIDSETGRYQGGDTQLLKMLLQTVHNIQDRKRSSDDDPTERLEKVVPIAMKLLKSLGDFEADDSASIDRS